MNPAGARRIRRKATTRCSVLITMPEGLPNNHEFPNDDWLVAALADTLLASYRADNKNVDISEQRGTE
jgi:hypothetical protein